MVNISIALFNTEQEILKADPNKLGERDKHNQRMRHRNQVLEKFYAGQTDEKYVKDYYEILKKADKFMKNATPHQLAVATNKTLVFNKGDNSYKIDENYRSNKKDQFGRRYEHYGFFDEKHKHAGKTLAEAIELDFEERRTKDDNYELEYIFNNKPLEVGFVKALDYLENIKDEIVFSGDTNQQNIIVSGDSKIEKTNIDVDYDKLVVKDITKLSKQFEFPIKIYREDNSILNKIEQLTEFLHIKKVNSQTKQYEFFIPLKFKTDEIENGSDIFNELININGVYIRNEYGELLGYRVDEYIKRIKYNDTHEVWKFRGIEMETVSNKI